MKSIEMVRTGLLASMCIALLLGPSDAAGPTVALSTAGLSVQLDAADGSVSSLTVKGKPCSPRGTSGGIYVEDVVSTAGPVPAFGSVTKTRDGAVQKSRMGELGLSIDATYRNANNHLTASIRVRDLTGKDRAIRLSYRIPVKNADWTWEDNILRSRKTSAPGRYENLQKFFWDPDGKVYPCERYISTYPFMCLRNADTAVSVGVPLNPPRIFCLRYIREKESGYLEVSFDLGISADVAKYPSESSVQFVIYSPKSPEWGFRSAADGYYGIYPKDFQKRVKTEGIWILAMDPDAIIAPWDFGFGFDETSLVKERYPNIKYGDIFDFYSCHYMEPWGMWLGFKGYGETKNALLPIQAGAKPADLKKQVLSYSSKEFCAMYEASAIYDENGDWVFINWTNEYPGVGERAGHLKLAMDPRIPGSYGGFILARTRDELDKARKEGVNIDGVYLDSLSAYVGFFPENYRREQWKYIDEPLVFNTSTKKVCQLHAFSNSAFVKAMTDYLHDNDMVLIANIYPSPEKFFYPFLDMIGVESDGGMSGCSDDFYAYLRTFASKKPVSWLDYNLIKTAESPSVKDERLAMGFERCLAWGVYPGTAEFTAKYIKYVEKRRPLYREFIPLIKELGSAGWEPVTYARSSAPETNVERFGNFGHDQVVHFTVFNSSGQLAQGAWLTVEADSLRLPGKPAGVTVSDMRTGKPLKFSVVGKSWRVYLPAFENQKTVAIRIATEKAAKRLNMDMLRERILRVVQTMRWLQAYPQGSDDAAKQDIATKASGFLENTHAQGLVDYLAGASPDKAEVRRKVSTIIQGLGTFPADRYREAMLEQAEAALEETNGL